MARGPSYALIFLGLGFVAFGLLEIIGMLKVVPCSTGTILGVCSDPFNPVENIVLGMFAVAIGAFFVVRGFGR